MPLPSLLFLVFLPTSILSIWKVTWRRQKPLTAAALLFSNVSSTRRPTRFFNSSNFPLDRAWYKLLTDIYQGCNYSSMDEIAWGMGEMLGMMVVISNLLWVACCSAMFQWYAIDFNQVRRRSITYLHEVRRCAHGQKTNTKSRFLWIPSSTEWIHNNPYCPRPRAIDFLYQRFCKGYASAYSEDRQKLASAVLRAFKQEQAQHDMSGNRAWTK